MTRASHLKDSALHLSPRPPPLKNISNPQPFDNRAECKGPRDTHILLRDVSVTEKLLDRQHPRDPLKSKGNLKPARPPDYPAKSQIHGTGIAWGAEKNKGD